MYNKKMQTTFVKTEQAYVKEPYVDGLVGGADCVNYLNNSKWNYRTKRILWQKKILLETITSREWLVSDKAKYTNIPGIKSEQKVCSIQICGLTSDRKNVGGKNECAYFSWSGKHKND